MLNPRCFLRLHKNKSEEKYVCSFQSTHRLVDPTHTYSPPLSLLPRIDLLHGMLGNQRVMIISILEVRRFNGEVVWFVEGFAKALRQTEKRIHFSWPPCLCLVCKAACLPSSWQNHWQGRRPYWSHSKTLKKHHHLASIGFSRSHVPWTEFDT